MSSRLIIAVPKSIFQLQDNIKIRLVLDSYLEFYHYQTSKNQTIALFTDDMFSHKCPVNNQIISAGLPCYQQRYCNSTL